MEEKRVDTLSFLLLIVGAALLLIALIAIPAIVGVNDSTKPSHRNGGDAMLEPLPRVKNTPPTPIMKPPKKNSGWSRWELFTVTAYTNRDEGCSDTTATGLMLSPVSRVVAVDPRVIPLHSYVEIVGLGVFYAEDKGGLISGNVVDVFMWADDESGVEAALRFGLRKALVRWKPRE